MFRYVSFPFPSTAKDDSSVPNGAPRQQQSEFAVNNTSNEKTSSSMRNLSASAGSTSSNSLNRVYRHGPTDIDGDSDDALSSMMDADFEEIADCPDEGVSKAMVNATRTRAHGSTVPRIPANGVPTNPPLPPPSPQASVSTLSNR